VTRSRDTPAPARKGQPSRPLSLQPHDMVLRTVRRGTKHPLPTAWRCPLTIEPFAMGESRCYPSTSAGNCAISAFRSHEAGTSPGDAVTAIYWGHLGVVRKALRRYCSRSRCHAGACLVEDLVGESFILFHHALSDYDSSKGLDFLGYLSRRLKWGLAKRIRKASSWYHADRSTLDDAPSLNDSDTSPESAAINRLTVSAALSRLPAADRQLLEARFVDEVSYAALACHYDTTACALRMRVSRLRARVPLWQESILQPCVGCSQETCELQYEVKLRLGGTWYHSPRYVCVKYGLRPIRCSAVPECRIANQSIHQQDVERDLPVTP